MCLKLIINALRTGDDASNNPAPVSASLARVLDKSALRVDESTLYDWRF